MSGPAPDLRILADDLTGALDSAAAFAGAVPVHFDGPPASVYAGGGVSVLSTGTRDLDPVELPHHLRAALDWWQGADIAFKKVDSLLRGNTFAELRLAAAGRRFDRIVFAPAFPAQGRFTVEGRLQLADGSRPAAAPVAAEALAGCGLPLELPEVRSDADLQALAARVHEGAARRWMWCGSAGLAHALARELKQAPVPPAAPDGVGALPLLLVSASHHAVARRQWQRLCRARPHAACLRGGDAAALQALLAAPRAVSTLLLDLAPETPLDAARAAALLARQLRAIVGALPRPGVLVVVGGDTLLGLCRAGGATALRASASTRPGWGQARWCGGPWDGLPCHSRSGAFGDDDDLLQMVAALQPSPAGWPG